MEECSSPTTTSNGLPANDERNEHTPLHPSNSDTASLRLVITFFSFFTITLTAALGLQIYYGHPQVGRHGSISCDSKICSAVGISVIKQGGNAVDAVIAAAFCLSVVNPHVTGLGGGGFMLIYDQKERRIVDGIDFRVKRSTDSRIGVPGFVAGLAFAHKLYGFLPWKMLLEPAINIAKSGFVVPPGLLAARSHLLQNVTYNERLKRLLESLTSRIELSLPDIASTLSFIAQYGSAEFYNVTLRSDLGDLLDENDITSYEPIRGSVTSGMYKDFDIIVSGQGSGGPQLIKALNNISNSTTSYMIPLLEQFRGIEKVWSYTSGSTVVAFDVDDLYVSVVSGLGSVLGSQMLTTSGYVLNNFLETTKDPDVRPAILMTPVIAVNRRRVCGKRLGSGTADIRDLSQLLVRLLDDGTEDVRSSVEAQRIRVLNRQIELEILHKPTITREEQELLASRGYQSVPASVPYPSINVVEKTMDTVIAYADSRGFGSALSD